MLYLHLYLPSKHPRPDLGIERGAAVYLELPRTFRALPRPTTPITNSYENITVYPQIRSKSPLFKLSTITRAGHPPK